MPNAPLIIFSSPSKEGQLLADEIFKLATQKGYAAIMGKAKSFVSVQKACFGPGIVVFDATIESADEHNYHLALYTMKSNPFVLVVSRSYLPTNFQPFFNGGYPVYPNRKSNDEILVWVDKRLSELRSRIPRPESLQGRLNKAVVESGVEEFLKKQLHDGSIFISYRGTQQDAVKKLAETTRIKTMKTVHFFSSGELAPPNELMSAQDRWHVMSSINFRLIPHVNAWIFWSADYIKSWWTKMELILIASKARFKRPAVYIYNEENGRTSRCLDVWLANIGSLNRAHIIDRLLYGRNPEWLSRSDRQFIPSELNYLVNADYRDDLIFSCPSCASASDTLSTLQAPKSFRKLLSFNINDAITLNNPDIKIVSKQKVADTIKDGQGYIDCPDCNKRFKIKEAPLRYWFYPVRVTPESFPNEIGTGPNGTTLEPRPAYLLVKE